MPRLVFGFQESLLPTRKILIVDDEKIARQRILRLLGEPSRYEILEATNGLEALDLLSTFKPHVVFLDVQMPVLTGFDVLQQVETRDFQIIFQTAYDEYALRAFEESACDYLLKPFSQERFDKALAKALEMQGQQEKLRKLEASLHQNNQFLDKVTFKQGGKLKVLHLNDVACFTSQDHYTCAYTLAGSEHIVDLSISYLSKHLNPNHFIQCHRSGIVALEQIQAVGGVKNSLLQLKTGMEIPLSRSNRSLIIENLKSLKG